jgi:hypothetical protein
MSLAKFRKISNGKCTEKFHIGPSDGSTCQCKLETQDATVTPDPIMIDPPKINEE